MQPEVTGLPRPIQGLPLTELAWDTVLSALTYLGASDLSASSTASRLLFLLVREAQRRPSVVTEVGLPSDVFAALGQRLSAMPTLGFLFSTGSLQDEMISKILRQRLPPSCHLIGATTPELQVLVRPREAAESGPDYDTVGGFTELRNVRERGNVAVMLGSFPDSVAYSFHFSGSMGKEILECSSDTAALATLRKHALPCGDEWKTIVLIVSQKAQLDPDRILQVFQKGNPNTAILGGIAGEEILMHSRGHTRVYEGGVVGLALRGSVPLTALVSRGSKPFTPSMQVSGANVAHGMLSIPRLLQTNGTEILPIQVVIDSQNSGAANFPKFVGVRYRVGAGYKLEGVHRDMFDEHGGMQVSLDNQDAQQSLSECEVRFYQLDPDACKADLRNLLGYVQQQAIDEEEEVLGSIMFTCGGRSERFYKENSADMKQFQSIFPSLPLIGFWAGGEIGPQAFAESGPSEATRTGNAAFQGFTAVFGIFRAPKNTSSRLRVLAMGDEQLPQATGEIFAGLASEARERGNSAFKEGLFTEASEHYSRASALAGVPSAGLSSKDQAVILSNRAMTWIKKKDFATALVDANAAVALDPHNAKAHHRRGQALLALGRLEESAVGLRVALEQLAGSDAAQLSTLQKLLAQVDKNIAKHNALE